jgi:hypothetical protein
MGRSGSRQAHQETSGSHHFVSVLAWGERQPWWIRTYLPTRSSRAFATTTPNCSGKTIRGKSGISSTRTTSAGEPQKGHFVGADMLRIVPGWFSRRARAYISMGKRQGAPRDSEAPLVIESSTRASPRWAAAQPALPSASRTASYKHLLSQIFGPRILSIGLHARIRYRESPLRPLQR